MTRASSIVPDEPEAPTLFQGVLEAGEVAEGEGDGGEGAEADGATPRHLRLIFSPRRPNPICPTVVEDGAVDGAFVEGH